MSKQQAKIKAGVVGWPVDHSLSPWVHGFWLQQFGIDGEYIRIPASPDNFENELRARIKDGFAGFNITVPHKERALAFADHVDANAKRIGAVNTLVISDDGSVYGSNTDGFGFMENLKSGADGWRSDCPAVVLGAGGAARAVVVALLDAGVPEIRVLNRTRARAETLCAEIDGERMRVYDWEDLQDPRREAIYQDAGLLVNTTSLGMRGQPPLGISLDGLPDTAVVTDLVYVPLETELLAQARKAGHRVVDGLGMLLHQARPGFAAWFGVDVNVSDALREHVLRAMENSGDENK